VQKTSIHAGYEVLTAVLVKSHIFWDVIRCWVSGSQCYKGM